jgi:hypothetical protein
MITGLPSSHTNPKQGFRFCKGARFSFPKCKKNTKPGKIMHYLNRTFAGTTKSGNFLDHETLKHTVKRAYCIRILEMADL